MASIAHKDLTGAALHEPKGVDAAGSGTVYTADGAGSGNWTTASGAHGIYVYADVTTGVTPIALTLADTFYDLTNDGAGAGSSVEFALGAAPNMWDTSTNEFIFTGLKRGDFLTASLDIDFITSGANHAVSLQATVGVGGTTSIVNLLNEVNFKTAGTYNQYIQYTFPILTDNVLNNTVTLQAASDATGDTVTVNSFQIITTST